MGASVLLPTWPLTLLGVAVCGLAVAAIRRLARHGGPFRSGPWPGLTARGAGLLLAHAWLVQGGQLLLGAAEVDQRARGPFPWLPLAVAVGFAPLLLAAGRIIEPGVVSAVAGAYLLPRSLLSLLLPGIAPPLALWPAVFLLDLGLRARALPARYRAPAAGGAAGFALALTEVLYALVLQPEAGAWTSSTVVLGVLGATAAGATVAAALGPPGSATHDGQ